MQICVLKIDASVAPYISLCIYHITSVYEFEDAQDTVFLLYLYIHCTYMSMKLLADCLLLMRVFPDSWTIP